jgi:hypothetical protein
MDFIKIMHLSYYTTMLQPQLLMKNKIIPAIIFTVFAITSCNTTRNDILFERSILENIIPRIVDSICHDTRIFLNPPPILGELVTQKDGHVVIDTTLATTEQKLKYNLWKKRQDSLRLDTSQIILAFDPKIHFSSDSLELEFKRHFIGKEISNYQHHFKDSSYTLKLHSIKLNKKFKFKNRNEFPKSLDTWSKKYDFTFSGFFYVSRILFDKSKKCGILSASYNCGGRCGQGYIICIKKLKEIWVIDKIQGTWIS